MGKILIENYRGFDIEFDTCYEKFQCICTEDNTKESNSFSSIKKFIDDYKKNNQDFVPFWVVGRPDVYTIGKKLNVIGLRKDNRFVAESADGKKTQIADYELSNYMLIKEENKQAMLELDNLNKEEDRIRKERNASRKEIMSRLNITTLKDFKNQL